MIVTLPVGSSIKRIEGNTVVLAMPDHSEALIHTMTCRVRPLVGDVWSYQVKTVLAQVDPVSGKLMYSAFDIQARNIGFQDSTDVQASRDAALAFVSGATMKAAMTTTGLLPYELESA